MRQKLYHALVNKQTGISYRYHLFHDGSNGIRRIVSWGYLLWLNFAFYILGIKRLGKRRDTVIYENKKLPTRESESDRVKFTTKDVVDYLGTYDLISFDLFDTLIFRPFSAPTDLFYLLQEKMGILNLKDIRVEMERKTRENKKKEKGIYEVTISEIWGRIEEDVGIFAKWGIGVEEELELSLCYANPFMKEVYEQLIRAGKRVVITTDMYFPEVFLRILLKKNGYSFPEELFVSCAYGKSKGSGELFRILRERMDPENKLRMIHVGDNEISDIKMAKKMGLDTFYYPNIHKLGNRYRAMDMSKIIGGAYRGIVNAHIYQGKVNDENYPYSMLYEYGYLYGGIFVFGYCHFIHDYCKKHDVERILFLARDGDILKRIYDRIYPCDETEYVYWSRKAGIKLMFSHNKLDYRKRFLKHKVNCGYTIREILSSMELTMLISNLDQLGLKEGDMLTSENEEKIWQFIEKHMEMVTRQYQSQIRAAEIYFDRILSGCKKAAVVDIGWAGSGAMSIDYLVHHVFRGGCGMDCEMVGIVAGTNTPYNTEPDASEAFLQSGKMVSYLYSQRHNRELLKRHNPDSGYNIFWELLLSSTEPSFQGFYLNEEGNQSGTSDEIIHLSFGKSEQNPEGIKEIQRGIEDFTKEYQRHFGEFPFLYDISGRDAYAPMLLASGQKEKYLRKIQSYFSFHTNVE